MTSCLEKAEATNCVSIAFPAVGSGVLQYNLNTVADQMFRSVYKFGQRSTSVKQVTFVVYPSNKEAVMVGVLYKPFLC